MPVTKKSGIKASLLMVSTRNNRRVLPGLPNPFQFNNTLAYVPVDSTRYYALDASNKYNVYNQVPANILNSFGLYFDKDQGKYDLIF
jgi:hypothetical protein